MKFFIPLAKDEQETNSVYDGIKQFLTKELGAIFTDDKIRSLRYTHEGTEYYAEVGSQHALNGEPVIAILYDGSRDLYQVCTPNRGVARDMPILVGHHTVWDIEYFDKD